jgi:hypothetical protein
VIVFAEIKSQMLTSAAAPAFPAGATVGVVWGLSVREILQVVMDRAIELGREYRPQIEEAAREAVDALVQMDIPGVPAIIEGAIDSATREAGYEAVKSILDALIGAA